jgi:hypothetical protein
MPLRETFSDETDSQSWTLFCICTKFVWDDHLLYDNMSLCSQWVVSDDIEESGSCSEST